MKRDISLYRRKEANEPDARLRLHNLLVERTVCHPNHVFVAGRKKGYLNTCSIPTADKPGRVYWIPPFLRLLQMRTNKHPLS